MVMAHIRTEHNMAFKPEQASEVLPTVPLLGPQKLQEPTFLHSIFCISPKSGCSKSSFFTLPRCFIAQRPFQVEQDEQQNSGERDRGPGSGPCPLFSRAPVLHISTSASAEQGQEGERCWVTFSLSHPLCGIWAWQLVSFQIFPN